MFEHLRSTDPGVAISSLTIFGAPQAQFDAVSAGRFFVPLESDPMLYRLTEDGLPLALGLSLLSAVQKAERNSADLDEELSLILDPVTALDKTSDVLLAGILAGVLDPRASDEVAAALIRAFVGLQNADDARYPEYRYRRCRAARARHCSPPTAAA